MIPIRQQSAPSTW